MIPESRYRFSEKIMRKIDVKSEGVKPGTTEQTTTYTCTGVAAFLIARGEPSRYKVAGERLAG
jgi:hypothetical protein